MITHLETTLSASIKIARLEKKVARYAEALRHIQWIVQDDMDVDVDSEGNQSGNLAAKVHSAAREALYLGGDE